MGYSISKNLILSVFPAVFKPTCLSSLASLFRKDNWQLQICCSWVTKGDLSDRKINEWFRIGDDKCSFYDKITRKNHSCHQSFYILNQHTLLDKHKSQVVLHFDMLQLRFCGSARQQSQSEEPSFIN